MRQQQASWFVLVAEGERSCSWARRRMIVLVEWHVGNEGKKSEQSGPVRMCWWIVVSGSPGGHVLGGGVVYESRSMSPR